VGGIPQAAHLPFQFVDGAASGHDGGALLLEGHGAIRNSFLTGLEDGADVLVVFSGPSAYVTPGVYRAEPDVPTWNYTAVHVRGKYYRLPPSDNPALLERTVRLNEQGELGTGWSTRQMSIEDLESLSRGVISFHLVVEEITAGRKLSQDKLQEDARAVESHLASASVGEARDVAAHMRGTGLCGRSGPPSTDPAVWLDGERDDHGASAGS
jgi:transcriptional regulator